MSAAPSIWLAFIAGLVSFISPCCLPLYPSYISYISGVAYERGAERSITGEARRRAVAHAFFFVLGFSVIFVALGASASLIGILFAEYHTLISQIGGLIIIVMGLILLGVIKWDVFMREVK
ncbi:MAG: cytochrome c biogenesis CcdA family protein, partial [Sulfobacillus sp.]